MKNNTGYVTFRTTISDNIVKGIVRLIAIVAIKDDVKKQPLIWYKWKELSS